MRKSKLDLPAVKAQVVRELSTGTSQEKVAEMIGIDQSRISRWSRREDIRQALEHEAMKLAASIPDAVNNYKGLIRNFDKLKGEDKKLAFRASTRLLEAGGILNNPQPGSIFVSFTQNNNFFGSPAAQAILDRLPLSVAPPSGGIVIDYDEDDT